MTKAALLVQLLQRIKLVFRLPLAVSPSCQWYKTQPDYQEIQKKDILTLDEAAAYISTDPKILLKEVSCGHIPGGQLAGQWLFYKWALAQRFAGYQQSDYFEEDDITENFPEQIPQVCDAKVVSRLLDEYASGERNFSGIDFSLGSYERRKPARNRFCRSHT